jgi:type II secretory pathway pseudopilin PulG
MMKTMRTATIKKAISNQQSAVSRSEKNRQSAIGNRQSGYSLVSLMAMMTLLAIAMMAIAPSIQLQIQREKELEAIRRGEEVAEAIRQYVNHYNGAKFPNSIDDLLEGIPYGTKKRQILRESAAIDPLSEDGKWRLVGVESKSMVNFARRVQNYNNGLLPSSENVNPTVVNKMGVFLTNLDTKNEEDTTGADDDDGEVRTDNTPFIGVVSQSKNKSFIAYYGIENHSKWVFTPLFRGAGSIPTSSRTTEGTRDRIPDKPPGVDGP